MKPVRLKPNSPEFADEVPKRAHAPHTRCCDMPDCRAAADYRAPKDRSLNEHYWFCRDHVAAYNTAWNYFSGMNAGDVEHYMTQSLYGMRPTRPFSDWSKTAEELEEEIYAFRFGHGAHHTRQTKGPERQRTPRKAEATPERDALKIMGLEETLDFDVIKARYKQLAKQLHPDLNPTNKEAEEQLKLVNMAYTILRVAFARVENNG